MPDMEWDESLDGGIFSEIMQYHYREAVKQNEIVGSKPDIGDQEVTKKKEKPSEALLRKISKHGFNLEQMGDCLKTHGNQLVISGAGSGKTTTLIFKLLYDFTTGYATKVIDVNGEPVRVSESMWVCTFLHTGAEELESDFKKWSAKLHLADVSDSIQFSTIHAEFMRALKQFGFYKLIVKGKDNSRYLKEAVKPYQLRNAKGNPLNSEDYTNLEGALSYTRNRLDSKRYERDIYDDLGLSATIIDCILRDWKQKRADNNVVDFDDLQELIYDEVYKKGRTDLAQFLASRYNFIYIDEFQDTSQIQYAVLKLYCQDYKQLFVIGDDDQTIYSWRGSDYNIITKEFLDDFQPNVNKLSINYRCPSNILNAIIPSIEQNKNRYEKELKSSVEGGELRVIEGHNYMDMADKLSDCVYADLKAGRSVAILCRVNTDGLLPALIFDRLDKFTYAISGEGMTLDNYIGRTVLSIVKLFTERASAAVRSALNSLAWDSYNINNLINVCKTNKTSIWEIDENDLSYSCPSIAERIIRWRKIRKEMGEMKCLKAVLMDYRTNVYNRDNQFETVMRATLSTIETMLEYSGCDDAESFLYELEYANERLKGRIKNNKCFVRIATVHEFKGKEADSVYIWNDTEGVYPIKKVEYGTEEYDEERRIHYIACTRARQVSTLVYLTGQEGDFVKEMNLDGAYYVGEEIGGVVKGIINKNLEESGNLEKFIKSAAKSDGEESSEDKERSKGLKKVDEFLAKEYNRVVTPASTYNDNEFWGMDGNDFSPEEDSPEEEDFDEFIDDNDRWGWDEHE